MNRDHHGIHVNFFRATETNIYHSTGCKNCFENGHCPQDNLSGDEMKVIKQKMLESDFIVLASPVYSHNVSGDMKVLIDRLSYWAHLLRLNGKPGAVIVSASTNGADLVEEYLCKVARYMGMIIVDRTTILTIDEEEEKEQKLHKSARVIQDYLHGVKQTESNDHIEAIFQTMKAIVGQQEEDYAEYRYWQDSGLFDSDSFQDYLDRIRSKQTV